MLCTLRKPLSHTFRNKTEKVPLGFCFFLLVWPIRSEARSLHEKKLLVRKLLHGCWWSHAAWQIKTQGKTQILQLDLRLTIRKTAKQTANGARANKTVAALMQPLQFTIYEIQLQKTIIVLRMQPVPSQEEYRSRHYQAFFFRPTPPRPFARSLHKL